jgi:hypothetical protein
LLPINGLFVIVIDIAGSILASRLLVNRDIKLRKKPGDDAEALGFFFSVVLLNFDSSSLALLVIGATDGVEKMYDVLLLKPGFDLDFDGMLINYAIKKLLTRVFHGLSSSSPAFADFTSAFGLRQSHHFTPVINRWCFILSFPNFNR